MGNYKRRLQYAKPFWLSKLDDTATGHPLTRLTFSPASIAGEDKYDESWLQRLLQRHPGSLPITELEPSIGDLVPVGMEMPTPAGSVDNVLVTTDGNIVLVECKLWRNPDARRRVIAQIIDYAQSISRWGYREFDAAIRKSQDPQGRPLERSLVDIVGAAMEDPEDLDEPGFIDAIQTNLRTGRLLLVVVGDGVREDIESLADYLQMHAGFHFTLALIEVAIFPLPMGGAVVQPRVLARTLNIERAIVRLAGPTLVAEPVQLLETAATRMSLTEELFFEKLTASSPQTAAALKSFLEVSQDDRVFLSTATKSASLRWESAHGKVFTLGAVDLDGKLQSYAVNYAPSSIERLELAHDYLEKLAGLVGGSVRKTPSPTQWYIVRKGMIPPALDALAKVDDWLALIREYQRLLNEAENDMTR